MSIQGLSLPPEAPSFGGHAGGPGQLQGASFGQRAIARIIDHLLHYLVTIVTAFFVGAVIAVVAAINHHPMPPIAQKFRELGYLRYSIPFLGYIGYTSVCEGLHGSTLGKLMLGLVVVDDSGRPCGLRAAVVRSVIYFIDAIFFGLVGYLEMQKSPQEKRHGDNLAHTIVCKRSSLPPTSLRGPGRFVGAVLLGLMFDATMTVAAFVLALLR